MEAERRVYDARDALGMDGCVVILNGFQISHDVELHDRDELFLIRKGQMPKK